MPGTQIERAFFRETPHGATVFFPWGLTHRGYELPDDSVRKRAARAASLMIGGVVAIGSWTAYALQPVIDDDAAGLTEVLSAVAVPAVALFFVLLVYALWAWRFVESYPMSDLVISRDERLREAAQLAQPWKLALIGFVLSGLSASIVLLQPHAWWIGLLGVGLGVGLVTWSSVLRRAARDPGE